MKERWLWLISVLSGIDSAIIDEASVERARLLMALKKRRRMKRIAAFAAIAASITIVASTLFFIIGNVPDAVPYSIVYSETVDGRELYKITYPDGRVADFFVENAPKEDNTSNVKQVNMNEDGELLVTLKSGAVINLGKNVGKEQNSTAENVSVSGFCAKSGGIVALGLSNNTELDLGKHHGNSGNAPMNSAYINDAGELVIGFVNGGEINLGRVVGKDGKDGVGIDSMSISEDGNLTVILTNGTVLDLGNIKGKDGIGIAKSEINDQGELVLTYTDGNSVNLGRVVGKDGKDGVGIDSMSISDEGNLTVILTNGTVLELGNIKGKDGIGIAKSEINESGELVLTYTDGNSVNIGRVVGKDGKDGVGIDSMSISEEGNLTVILTSGTVLDLGNIKGKDGIGIAKSEINESGELVITYTDENSVNLGRVVGKDGKDGVGIGSIKITEEGELNITLTDGTLLELGNIKGEDGKSAYELYCEKYGYEGSEEEWLFDLANGLLAEKIEYTVSFDTGCDYEIEPQGVQKGEKATEPENPVRAGYTFDGWYAENGDRWMFSGYSITSDTVIYAHWKTVTYSITYTDADNLSDAPESYTVEDESFTLPVPEKLGCVFLGWKLGDEGEPNPELTVEKGSVGDLEFIAAWEILKYSITYELNGGNNAANPTEYDVTSPDLRIKTPKRRGYKFDGWSYKDDELSERHNTIIIESGSTGDVELVAHWNLERYEISYINLYGAENTNPNSYTVVKNDIILTAPKREGYEFLGWTFTGQKEPVLDVTIPKGSVGTCIFSANWRTIIYSITYDLAGGSISAKNPTKYTAESESFTLNNPTKTGYDFVGWSYVEKGETVTATTVTVSEGSFGDRSYIATWTPTVYKIKYNTEGGALSASSPKEYTIEGGDITIPKISRIAYKFLGWTWGSVTEPELLPVIPAGSMGDITFTAVWEPIAYNLTAVLDGGVAESNIPSTFTAPDLPLKLPDVKKADTYFAGWYSDPEHTVPIISIDGYSDITVYAGYKEGTLEGMEFAAISGGGYKITSYYGSEKDVLIPYFYEGEPVVEIADGAFEKSSITSISITKRIRKIGNSAFKSSASLTSVKFSGGMDSIGDSAFESCTSLSSVTFSGRTESIGKAAFRGCSNLSKISLPHGITLVSEEMFANCTRLSSVIIPSTVTKIGMSAFKKASSLRSVRLPEGLLYIEYSAFYGARLTEVTIPKSTLYIGGVAFGGDTVTSIKFANGSKIAGIGTLSSDLVERLKTSANRYGSGYYIGSEENPYLVHIAVEGLVTKFELHPDTAIVMGYSRQTKITSVTVPEGVRGIGGSAFVGCTALSSVTVANALTVCDQAFVDCSKLTSVNLGEGLMYLGDYAFDRCPHMYSITLPTTLPVYGENCMPSVSNIKRGTTVYKFNDMEDLGITMENSWTYSSVPIRGISYQNSAVPIYTDTSEFSYAYVKGELFFVGCSSFDGGVFTVPDEIYNTPVTAIVGLARHDNAKITKIEIPSSVTYLAGKLFDGCKIEGVFVVPESITHINDYAFSGFEVDEIVLPQGITDLGSIYPKSLVKHVTLNNNVTRIENFAFSDCDNLEYVILGKQIRYIGGMPFWQGEFTVDLFYEGTKDEFDMGVALAGRDSLAGTKLYCYSEEAPSESGDYWHYVNGVPTKW